MYTDLYEKDTANYPRFNTDSFFADYKNKFDYDGLFDSTFKFIEEFQLLDDKLWKRFVHQFREDSDFDGGWRGEYWGKMMRGACFVYSYTQNRNLYEILEDTVLDMINSADENGRISSYGVYHEFEGWDLWSRKYVFLGMQYFLEICKDEKLSQRIIRSMCGQLDYIMSKIGDGEGKRTITSTTMNWRGLNSSSILEPVVRLYSLTKEKKYLDFAKYIVSSGGIDVVNIFDLAYKNEFYPYQYPITKAYEMISCFEGLLEYYRITGEEKYKIAVVNFADKILESDFTVIGCCGCTHELFDHSTVRQANTTNGKYMQETCVTVTLMKFFYQLNLLTGKSRYADAFEISLYNAYLGAVNTEKVIDPTIISQHPGWELRPLPFDSYSPLTSGTRGNRVGGLCHMSDNHYYGCCACIGSAGIGLVPKMQLLTTKNGFAVNLYINGSVKSETPKGNSIIFNTITDYPKSGSVKIKISCKSEEDFEILIRNPYWSKITTVSVNGKKHLTQGGYISLSRIWKNEDEIEIDFDMRIEAIYPISYGRDILMNDMIWEYDYVIPSFDKEDPMAKNHVALRRGPIMLSQDNRLGYSVDEPAEIMINDSGFVDEVILKRETAKYPNIIEGNL